MGGGRAFGRGIVTAVVAAALLPAGAGAQFPSEAAPTPRAEPGSAKASKRAVSESELRRGLASRMRSVGGNSGAWVFNVDGGGDRTLFSRKGGSRRILASNTKLVTTATAPGAPRTRWLR